MRSTLSPIGPANVVILPGFCVWLPIELAQYESAALTRTADALAFVGGSLFLVGAYLGLLEAANRGMELDCRSSYQAAFTKGIQATDLCL